MCSVLCHSSKLIGDDLEKSLPGGRRILVIVSSSRLRTEGVSTNSVDWISKNDVKTLFRQSWQYDSGVS